jgi:type I restriction enzyme, S subunit
MIPHWNETSLGQEVDLIVGFPFQSKDYTDDISGVPLLRGDNIVQGTLRWENVKRWPLDKINNLEGYFLQSKDVIIAMDRPWIEAGLKYAAISEYDLPCLLVQRVACLRAKQSLDQRFLKYLISSAAFTNHILGIQTGSVVPHISGQQIKDFRFYRPPLSEQRFIAAILGSLDDKIENNRRMNATLEAIARALFQSWFVDFDPVRAKSEGRMPEGMDPETAALFPDSFEESGLGLIPRGWDVKPIGDLVKVVGGSTPSTTQPEFWEGGIIHWVTPKDLSKLSTMPLLDTERKITEQGLQQIGSGLLPRGTVLLSSRAPIGYLVIAAIPVAINQGFIGMICNGDMSNLYIFFWTEKNMDVIKARASGTTFQEISKSNFRPILALVPPEGILRVFHQSVEPMYLRIASNLREQQSLIEVRDKLLSKLISGQLQINPIDDVSGTHI